MAEELPARNICGARRNSEAGEGEVCKQPAGYGTNHVGDGRCKYHGGNTQIVHGRYSHLKHRRLAEKIARFEGLEDPLNIEPELAMLRALTEDFVERFDAYQAALLDWHGSYIGRPLDPARVEQFQRVLDECERRMREYEEPTEDEWQALIHARETLQRLVQSQENKPRQILDIVTAKDLLSEVTKVVERIEKIRAQDAISRPELLRTMAYMGRVVETYVKDESTLDKIRIAWLGMHV